MTAERFVHLRCDGDSENCQIDTRAIDYCVVAQTVRDARFQAKLHGDWVYADKRDLCPECVEHERTNGYVTFALADRVREVVGLDAQSEPMRLFTQVETHQFWRKFRGTGIAAAKLLRALRANEWRLAESDLSPVELRRYIQQIDELARRLGSGVD